MTGRKVAPSAKSLTASQCAEARGLLGWSRRKLAEIALVAERTVDALEDGRSVPHPRAVENVRTALETAGVQFRVDGPRLRRSRAAEAELLSPPVERRRREVA